MSQTYASKRVNYAACTAEREIINLAEHVVEFLTGYQKPRNLETWENVERIFFFCYEDISLILLLFL